MMEQRKTILAKSISSEKTKRYRKKNEIRSEKKIADGI